MGTLTKVLRLLLLVLVILTPPFESASVFRRMIQDDEGEKHEQRINRPQSIYPNKLDNRRPFAVFPFWNKANDSSSLYNTTPAPPTPASFNIDIQYPRRIPPPSSPRSNVSNVIKRTRRRRKQVPSRQGIRVRRTTTTPQPEENRAVTPTVLTQLRTVSEMLVTRNVTSTRTVTEGPSSHFTGFTALDDSTTVLASEETSTTTPLPSTIPPLLSPIFEIDNQEKRVGREDSPSFRTENEEVTTEELFFPEVTSDFPPALSSTVPSHLEDEKEELRSPKRIRDPPAPVEIELLNPFEEEGQKAIERLPREEDTSTVSPSDYVHPGQYHEVNPGQYHEVNPGQYHEENPGQYHEINPGQYVQHSETPEGNPTTIQIHHRDEDKKVYNVQSKVDEFIIGEYGTISKSSGQTLQGVRYTAIGESVDSKLIYDTLIKFFNFQ